MQNNVETLRSTLLQLDTVDLHFIYIRVVFAVGVANQVAMNHDFEKIEFILRVVQNNSASVTEHFIKTMLDAREPMKGYKKNTEWVDPTNKRLCIFLWLSALKYSPTRQLNQSGVSDLFGNKERLYDLYQMPNNPSNSSQCFEFFDAFLYIIDNIPLKIQLIDQIRARWEQETQFKHKMLKALEIDDVQVTQWIWEYSSRIPGFQFNAINFNTFKEKLPLIQAFYDKLDINNSDKILVLNKAYSAFHAKKFKQKSKNIKGANFWLGPEQVRRLNAIASQKKLSEKDALYSLIEDNYLKLLK